jgi:hypothetical protein
MLRPSCSAGHDSALRTKLAVRPPFARRPAAGKVLVAGWVGVISAAWSVISARGRGADGGSTDAYRYAAGYGSITTAIDTATMNAAVMNTGAPDAGAATASISEGVS